jgi:FKBP-type peptidyl-prolyl cis-trans isomerase (trigger factor)
MQITQTVSEDLRRQYTVTVPASELDAKVTKRLEEMKRSPSSRSNSASP